MLEDLAQPSADEAVVRADPNRTLLPGFIVSAVVHEPWGCHPSFAQGHYDRDNDFYVAWREISQDEAKLQAWLDEWVPAPPDRAAYVAKMGDRLIRLRAREMPSSPVNYGY